MQLNLFSDDPDVPETDLSFETVIEVARNERRRLTLAAIVDADGRLSYGDIAERVAAAEYDTTVENLTSQQRKRVYVSLYQTHLPELEAADVIRLGEQNGRIEPTRHASNVLDVLDELAAMTGGDR